MQSYTDLIVVRHGETDANRELRFQGQVDLALNALGRAQSQRLAERLSAGVPDLPAAAALFSSDLIRARQTASFSEPVVGLQAAPLIGLREQAFGVFDGLTVAEIEARHAALWTRWQAFDADHALPGGGESGRQFHARVLGTVLGLVAAQPGQPLLLFTHGGVLDMLWRSAQGESLHGPRRCLIPNTGLNHLRWHGPLPDAAVLAAASRGQPQPALDTTQLRPQIEVVRWSDDAHLAGLPAQSVYPTRP